MYPNLFFLEISFSLIWPFLHFVESKAAVFSLLVTFPKNTASSQWVGVL